MPPPPSSGYAVPTAHQPYPYPHPPMYAPPVALSGQRLAEFGDRLVARLIDTLILSVTVAVIFFPIMMLWLVALFRGVDVTDPSSDPDPIIIVWFLLIYCGFLLFTAAMMYVYEVEMMFRRGQTIGKRIMKIRVIPLDTEAPLSRGTAAKRFLVGNLAPMVVPGLSWVDGLWQLWDKPYRQCLHDKFARTVVVKVGELKVGL